MSASSIDESERRERAFDEMVAEWGQVRNRTQAGVDANLMTSDEVTDVSVDSSDLEQRFALVAQWESDIIAIAADELKLRESGKWVRGRDDFFGVLGLERYELSHSKIIGWLLDPCAQHGLGVSVLARLLRLAFGDEIHDALLATLGNANPECEVGRIDILVKAPGLTLIIENKVDAPESEAQCDGYYERFKGDPGALFLFLTPEGRRPASASGSALEAFKSLSYGDFRMILRAALDATASDAGAAAGARARHIAQDYCHTLEKEFR